MHVYQLYFIINSITFVGLQIIFYYYSKTKVHTNTTRAHVKKSGLYTWHTLVTKLRLVKCTYDSYNHFKRNIYCLQQSMEFVVMSFLKNLLPGQKMFRQTVVILNILIITVYLNDTVECTMYIMYITPFHLNCDTM